MARFLIGIDLGTSGVRVCIFDENAAPVSTAEGTFPLSTPVPGIAEQDPEDWWRETCRCLGEATATSGAAPPELAGISFSGQMHGTVMVGADGCPVRPAVIWADTRSGAECPEIEELLGDARLDRIIMNRIFPGAQAATLRWMMRNEPENWKRTRHILTPKDYIRFRMCGLFNTEPSDGSGTLLFDVPGRDWAEEALGVLNIPLERLPFVVNSDQYIAETEGIAEASGIPDGVPLVMGGGDQPCAALGNGVTDEGTMLLKIGSGGQLFAPTSRPRLAPDRSLTSFCHIHEGRWYVMGATLAAGMSLRWFRDTIGGGLSFGELAAEAETAPPGAGDVLFTPHLSGKRSPDFRPDARGAFTGLGGHHDRSHLTRAVMEGVVFDLKENLDAMDGMGIVPETVVFTGGAAKSRLWTRIAADILEKPLAVREGENRSALGAALAAGVGTGVFSSWKDAVERTRGTETVIEPDPASAELYRGRYHAYIEATRDPDSVHPARGPHM